MHYWTNKSITKGLPGLNFKKLKANRPKEVSDEDWNELVKEAKVQKLTMVDKMPRASKKAGAPRRASKDEE